MTNTTTRTRLAMALLCGVLSAPTIATAGLLTHESNEPAVEVPLTDLNLSHSEGVVELYQRLQAAARQVCGSQDFRIVGSLKIVHLHKQCYGQALNTAVQTIDNPQLSELHTG